MASGTRPALATAPAAAPAPTAARTRNSRRDSSCFCMVVTPLRFTSPFFLDEFRTDLNNINFSGQSHRQVWDAQGDSHVCCGGVSEAGKCPLCPKARAGVSECVGVVEGTSSRIFRDEVGRRSCCRDLPNTPCLRELRIVDQTALHGRRNRPCTKRTASMKSATIPLICGDVFFLTIYFAAT